jgi:hypothetical protein
VLVLFASTMVLKRTLTAGVTISIFALSYIPEALDVNFRPGNCRKHDVETRGHNGRRRK